MTFIYQTTGTLTDYILPENVKAAQEYLTEDDMTQYLGDNRYPTLKDAVDHIEWRLDDDGYKYSVTAKTNRRLGVAELEHLADWVSGQNSDGLGEGFEQQDFAWAEEDCEDCVDSSWGCECGNGHMISFDWKKNESRFTLIQEEAPQKPETVFVDVETGTVLNGPIVAVSGLPDDLSDQEVIEFAQEHGVQLSYAAFAGS